MQDTNCSPSVACFYLQLTLDLTIPAYRTAGDDDVNVDGERLRMLRGIPLLLDGTAQEKTIEGKKSRRGTDCHTHEGRSKKERRWRKKLVSAVGQFSDDPAMRI